MKAPKLCRDCKEREKDKGSPSFCAECRWRRMPITERRRVVAAKLAAVPPELRKRVVPERFWPPGRRWCGGCQSFVLLRDVPKSGSRCITCSSIDAHSSRLKATFGITPEQYQALYDASGGRCYLCGRKSGRNMAVDHDHKTGEVRGLLCPDVDWGCNLKVVPRFDRSPDPVAMVHRLLNYLTEPPARAVLGLAVFVPSGYEEEEPPF